jgi:hypothetical protein
MKGKFHYQDIQDAAEYDGSVAPQPSVCDECAKQRHAAGRPRDQTLTEAAAAALEWPSGPVMYVIRFADRPK